MSAVAVQPEHKQLCKSKIGYGCYIGGKNSEFQTCRLKRKYSLRPGTVLTECGCRLFGLFVQGSSLMRLNGIKLAVSKLLQWLNDPSLYWTWQYTSTIIDWTQGKGLHNPRYKGYYCLSNLWLLPKLGLFDPCWGDPYHTEWSLLTLTYWLHQIFIPMLRLSVVPHQYLLLIS